MPDYTPPIAEMILTLRHAAGYEDSPAAAALDLGTLEAVLEEAGKLAFGVLAPLNWSGDRHGAQWADGVVTTAPGFREAYRAYCDGGWNAVPFTPDYGGQGLPWAAAFAVQEMWQAANMSFGLCPLLNQGATEAIWHHGSDAQKALYLPKLISGQWTGTMNLTEPQAGSDLGAIRTRAEKQSDGTYKIFGQKIFITYGEHDLAENIIHLVLARVAGAPEGPKGISLFIVPKFMVGDDGHIGARNDVLCTGIEHKLGIHASPTCTMQFGDRGGAIGFLVGAENEGLKYMFTMMNNARLSVGLQGVAIADRATQAAVEYANGRVQGRQAGTGAVGAIAHHTDVRRMMLTMRAYTLAARALTYQAAVELDRAAAGVAGAQEQVELLTPIVKGWGTDMAQTVTSLGVQVHGGMGFVEETGAAQFYRDARILPIYEGTNGIQALDLAARKIVKNNGAVMQAWTARAQEQVPICGPYLRLMEMATAHLVATGRDDADRLGAMASPYLQLCGTVMGGAAIVPFLSAPDVPDDMARAVQFYFDQIMPLAQAYHAQVMGDVGTMLFGGV